MAHDRLLDARVTLLGGSGFLGRHVAQELLARGARLTIASRHPERAFALKPLGNLGQVRFARCDIGSAAAVAAVVAGADAVVNLVGAFDGDLDGLQGRGVGRIAKAAREAGASAFVQVSANGADPESPIDYARTKAEGEEAVLAAFPGATILRPSIIFGPDDMFINRFGGLIAMLPVMPVFGPEAKLQPVFVDDVAEAIANALSNPAHAGKTYELCGPEVMTMLELNQRIAAAQCRNRVFAPLPDALSGAIALATGWAPGAPITHDQWRLLNAGNVASGKPGLDKLGIAPKPLGLFLDRWMVRFRKHGRFGDKAAAR
jgi:NADH dehydrogenase